MTERHRLVLKLSAIPRSKTDLGQRIIKARRFCQLRQFAVVINAPAGALLDFADDQATTDIWNPIGKFDGVLTHGNALDSRHVLTTEQHLCQQA